MVSASLHEQRMHSPYVYSRWLQLGYSVFTIHEFSSFSILPAACKAVFPGAVRQTHGASGGHSVSSLSQDAFHCEDRQDRQARRDGGWD